MKRRISLQGGILFSFSQAGQTQVPEIIHGGIRYLTIICLCSFGLFGQMITERLLQSTGLTFYSMITQMTGAIINIILDPIMIFGLFGFPRMGIAGAAAATVFGQFSATVLAVWFNLTRNREIHFRWKNIRPDPVMIRQILLIGAVASYFLETPTGASIVAANLLAFAAFSLAGRRR